MQPIVQTDGHINNNLIWRREALYKGMNGNSVERIYVTPSESYIFKPLTNDDQHGKEAWVYKNMLPAFPPVYPKMIASSNSTDPSVSWALFEDLGTLQHEFQEETSLALIEYIASWHSLPIDMFLHAPLRGPKPSAEAIRSELLLNEAKMRSLAAETLGIPALLVNRLYTAIRHESLPDSQVLSHGDLHLGNYALVNGHIKVLDWEHAHINSKYWDLYHVIDLSHPLFPKAMTAETRERLLNQYILLAEQRNNGQPEPHFKRGYYVFASMFSLWLLNLIVSDIISNNGTWPIEQLKQQLQETVESFTACVEQL